jgi:anti-sigma factor RsiW
VTRPVDERLSAYLDGELGPEERADLEARLREQPDAESQLAALRALERALGELPRIEPDAGFEARFRARLESVVRAEPSARAGALRRRLRGRGAWLGAGAFATAAAAAALVLWFGRAEPRAGDLDLLAALEDPETWELLGSEDVELLEVLEILEAWDGVQES